MYSSTSGLIGLRRSSFLTEELVLSTIKDLLLGSGSGYVEGVVGFTDSTSPYIYRLHISQDLDSNESRSLQLEHIKVSEKG